MILTVTLNAALDLTYEVDRFRLGARNQVRVVHQRAGGKGINVARVLHALGAVPLVSGLAGGPTGMVLRAELAAAGLEEELMPIQQESRRTLVVVDAEGEATLFSEPGPMVTAEEWRRARAGLGDLAARADAVVLSGSLPLGLPGDAYAQLIGDARAAGVPVLLDANGEALTEGLRAGPSLVKPNLDELAASAGGSVVGEAELLRAIAALRKRGAEAVVASLGSDGLIAVTSTGRWRVRPPEQLTGNATGAGDAVVAALTFGLIHREPWPERLRRAAALSAAAVRAPVAGAFDHAAYARYLTITVVEAI